MANYFEPEVQNILGFGSVYNNYVEPKVQKLLSFGSV